MQILTSSIRMTIGLLSLLILTSSSAFAINTADWMDELYRNRANTKLVDVTIPGTHQSGTYRISMFSKVEPGENFLYHFIKPIVSSWSKTQFKTIFDQLILGIRYLDFRVAFDKKNTPYVVHGLVSIPFKQALEEVQKFVTYHPREIVLIDYKLSYGYKTHKMKPEEETSRLQLLDQIVETAFNDTLMKPSENYTFADFWQGNRSIMVLRNYQDFWPNRYEEDSVRIYLEQSLPQITPGHFSKLQLIFTPPTELSVFVNPKYAVPLTPNENSISTFSQPLRSNGLQWLKQWHQQGYKINIVVSDFFDKFAFVNTLLDFNLLH